MRGRVGEPCGPKAQVRCTELSAGASVREHVDSSHGPSQWVSSLLVCIEPGRLQSTGLQSVVQDWSNLAHTHRRCAVPAVVSTIPLELKNVFLQWGQWLNPTARPKEQGARNRGRTQHCLCFLSFFFYFWPHGTWDLSSLTRDRTCAPCSGGAESEPLDGQGSPTVLSLKGWWGPSLLEPRSPCTTGGPASSFTVKSRWSGRILVQGCLPSTWHHAHLQLLSLLCCSTAGVSLPLSEAFPAPPPKFQCPAVISDMS